MTAALHLRGQTFHGRKGGPDNAFRYAVDYLLLDPEAPEGPALFSHNRGNLIAFHDRDHGGAPGQGRGATWLRALLAERGLPGSRIRLLTQPRVLGHVFNPVSFWLVFDDRDALRGVLAEVSNTFGDRHSYLCHRPDLGPITAEDRLTAQKLMHVSPFQPVEGGYLFRFDVTPDRIGIWIDYSAGKGGLMATLTGPLAPLTNRAILGFCLRRPFGSRRVLALIHWQALKLWWKGAPFRSRPLPTAEAVSPTPHRHSDAA